MFTMFIYMHVTDEHVTYICICLNSKLNTAHVGFILSETIS